MYHRLSSWQLGRASSGYYDTRLSCSTRRVVKLPSTVYQVSAAVKCMQTKGVNWLSVSVRWTVTGIEWQKNDRASRNSEIDWYRLVFIVPCIVDQYLHQTLQRGMLCWLRRWLHLNLLHYDLSIVFLLCGDMYNLKWLQVSCLVRHAINSKLPNSFRQPTDYQAQTGCYHSLEPNERSQVCCAFAPGTHDAR